MKPRQISLIDFLENIEMPELDTKSSNEILNNHLENIEGWKEVLKGYGISELDFNNRIKDYFSGSYTGMKSELLEVMMSTLEDYIEEIKENASNSSVKFRKERESSLKNDKSNTDNKDEGKRTISSSNGVKDKDRKYKI